MSDPASSPTQDSAVDAVFVIGTGSQNNNEELRYALRNLERNCPFVRDVYICGECPGWVDTSVVKHLKWPDRFRHAKDANIIDKLRHACEQGGIAKKILFCSDDQFQTRECTWEDFEPRWLRKYVPSDGWYEARKRLWHTRLRKTLERDRQRRAKEGLDQSKVYYYQPHIWMPIDRDRFIEYAKWCDYEHRDDTIIASGYFNFVDAGGKANFDHVFISQNQKWPVKATHIAYGDPSYNAAMQYLRGAFSAPSRFERQANVPIKRPEPPEPPKEPPKDARSDEEIIKDLLSRIEKEPAWASLKPEAAAAESLRKTGYPGWKKVWNDIIHRWNAATEKGKLRVPVTAPPSPEAAGILKAFHDHQGTARVVSSVFTPASASAPAQPAKKCTKCEERRRKAREEAERKAKEAREAMEAMEAVKRPEPPKPPEPSKEQNEDPMACMECAMDHLSVAVAYMGSNASRPTAFETELAKGEVRVAAQHLLALERNEEYNRCVQALDSVYSEKSTFSGATLKDILRHLMED